MRGFRVTKYDPCLRASDGSFTGREWTSVSDVGRHLGGGVVSPAEYLAAEDAYVEAALRFMRAAGLTELTVEALEKHLRATPLEERQATFIEAWAARVQEGDQLGEADVRLAVRAVLREQLWCRLVGAHGFYIHFGYEYYMYIGTGAKEFHPPQAPPGIFIEEFESPYAPEGAS